MTARDARGRPKAAECLQRGRACALFPEAFFTFAYGFFSSLRLLDHLLDPLALDAVEGRPVCEIVADYCGSSATAVEAGERVEALLSCRVLRRQPKLSGASSGHAAAGRDAHPDAKVARPSVHLHLLHRKGRPDGLRGARRGAGQLAAAARRSECRENRVAPRTELVSPNVLERFR